MLKSGWHWRTRAVVIEAEKRLGWQVLQVTGLGSCGEPLKKRTLEKRNSPRSGASRSPSGWRGAPEWASAISPPSVKGGTAERFTGTIVSRTRSSTQARLGVPPPGGGRRTTSRGSPFTGSAGTRSTTVVVEKVAGSVTIRSPDPEPVT